MSFAYISARLSADTYRLRLKQLERQSGEKLAPLAQDIRSQVANAYPSIDAANRESLAVNCFIDALRPKAIRTEVRRVNPDTLQAALKIAQREEDILVAENNSNTDNQSSLASIQEPVAENPARTSLEQRMNDLEGKVNEQIKVMQELVQPMRRQTRGRCYS